MQDVFKGNLKYFIKKCSKGIPWSILGAIVYSDSSIAQSVCIASASPGPSVTMEIVMFFEILRESTPSKLLALILRSPYSTQIEHWKVFAFSTNSVAGFAVRPATFFTIVSLVSMIHSPSVVQSCVRSVSNYSLIIYYLFILFNSVFVVLCNSSKKSMNS